MELEVSVLPRQLWNEEPEDQRSKALVFFIFFVCLRVGEYVSLDLLCFVNFTSICSLIPLITPLCVECVQYSGVQTIEWLPVFGIFFCLTCAQMQMYAIAHGGCTDTARESTLAADSGTKIPCRTRDSNPRQYCAWLSSRTLYQLSCSRPVVD